MNVHDVYSFVICWVGVGRRGGGGGEGTGAEGGIPASYYYFVRVLLITHVFEIRGRLLRLGILAAGEAYKAIFLPAPSFKLRTVSQGSQ